MKRFLFPLIFLALLTAFFRLGSVTLFDVDEAVFSQATKEMVRSGDWITPTYNGEKRFDKPILFYWLMAFSYKMFGINEFGARFPSALSGLLLSLSVFFFVRRACLSFRGEPDAEAAGNAEAKSAPCNVFADERAFYAATSLTLSLYFFAYSHAAVVDMALALFLSLSLFSFYLSVTEEKTGKKIRDLYICGFYLFSALAFLTKGLIGILFPFGIAFLFMYKTEGPGGLKKVLNLKGAVIFLIVSGPWYAAQFLINGREFIDQFIMKHHFRRFTEINSGHKGPFFFYVPVLIAGLFPWIAFLPAGLKGVLQKEDRLGLFSLIWMIFVFVFFSISSTKLPNYILPAVVSAAILVSSGIMREKGKARYGHILIALFSSLTAVAFLFSGPYFVRLQAQETSWTAVCAIIMLGLSCVCIYSLFFKKETYVYMSGLMLAFLLVLSAKALPIANQYSQGALFSYSLYAMGHLEAGDRIIAYDINYPSIVFYSDHKVVRVSRKADLLLYMSGRNYALAITKSGNIEMFQSLGFKLVNSNGRVALLEKNTR